MKPGPMNLITDVAGLRVGNATDQSLKSGVTVVVGDAPFVAGVNVMGGAPGTRETDLLAPDKMVSGVDALVLSGGSAFGLDAASGVANALHRDGRGFAVGDAKVPIVPAAILFDLLNGGDKEWAVNPYAALGADAYRAAAVEFALGSVGAGTGAMTATYKGGLGSSSAILDSGITIGALVAVNPIGSATDAAGTRFFAAPFEQNAEFGGFGVSTDQITSIGAVKLPRMAGNTTIAIVATDAILTKSQVTRMATAAQDGMARALQPSHTPMDGDLVFAVSTGSRQMQDPIFETMMLGHVASLCLARAIARAVYMASPMPGDKIKCFRP
jgi:L-aminopeptidase/D-esterase-like protein